MRNDDFKSAKAMNLVDFGIPEIENWYLSFTIDQTILKIKKIF